MTKKIKAEDIFRPISKEEIRKIGQDYEPIRAQKEKEGRMPLLDDDKNLKPKEYLQQNTIDLEHTLREPSLYYPGAGNDFGPFELFTQNSEISTVIYCDYSENPRFQSYSTQMGLLGLVTNVSRSTAEEKECINLNAQSLNASYPKERC